MWSASLDVDSERFCYYQSCMDPIEQARILRYRPERSRVRFICARGILKQLLGMYTGLSPQEIRFDYGALGKPHLNADLGIPIQFNATDTRNEALYAFCYGAELGVDIELASRTVKHDQLARKKLAHEEYNFYESLSEELRQNFILSLWTRKEAYGKARGVGIRYPLNEANLLGTEGLNDAVVTDQHGITWEIVQLSPKDDFTACVVTEGEGWQFRCFRFRE